MHGQLFHWWVLVLFGHSCQLVLTAVENCEHQGYLVILGSCFWLVSDVEDHLWTLSTIWAFLPIGSDVCLPLRMVYEHKCFWAFLPIGSDIWLLLSTLCDQVSFRYFANWFWYFTTTEDHLCLGSVCLKLCTSHPWRGFMTDRSFGVWVCIPFVWLVSLLPYVKWEIQVQFIKKNFSCGIMTSEIMTKKHFSCGIMTKEKSCGIMILFYQCMATIFFRFQIG